MIFAGEDYQHQKVQDLIAANKAKRQGPGPRDTREPLELKTIGGVLDQMLVVNRWLDAWHKKSEADWLSGWQDTKQDGENVNTWCLQWMLAAVSADEQVNSEGGNDE